MDHTAPDVPGAPVERQPLHHRRIDVQGYERSDGLFEVEATLTDTKAKPGARVRSDGVLHRMWIRVVFDLSLKVHDIEANSEVTPHSVCPSAAAELAALRGLTMGAGWNRAVRERLGAAKNCTHLVELLGPVASTAFQTTSAIRLAGPDKLDAAGRPVKIDTCLAYSRHGELVRRRWPAHHVPIVAEATDPPGDPR